MTSHRPTWIFPTKKDEELEPGAAQWWMERLLGPAHRLAWLGDDREGDRRRCVADLHVAVRAAYGDDGPHRTAAVLVDWWMQAALGESPIGTAWLLGDNLSGHPGLVQALEAVLEHQSESPALVQLRKPTRFVHACEHLRGLVERPVKFKKSPAPEIYGEAREQAWELVHRAETPKQGPIRDTRLLTEDVEDWASEPRGGREVLQRRLKVWNHLAKRLDELQTAALDLVNNWTAEAPARDVLPDGWRDWLGGELSPCAAVAEAVLHDIASVDPSYQGASPSCLRPEWLLDDLGQVPATLAPEHRVRLLAFAREALEAAPSHPAPSWVDAAENHLASLRTRIRSLRAQAESLGIDEAQQQLEEALSMLDRLDVSESAGWIEYAEETIEQQAQDAAVARLEREMATWLADLEEVGEVHEEVAPSQPGEELEQRHARIEAAWGQVLTRQRQRHERLQEAVQRLADGPTREQSTQKLGTAGKAIEGGNLGAARRQMDAIDDLLAAARRAMDERLRPELREIKARAEEAEFRDREMESIRSALHRIEARGEAELDHRWLIEALDALISAAERHEAENLELLGVLVDEGAGATMRRVRITHWLASGVEVDPLRFGGSDVEMPAALGKQFKPGDLLVVGGQSGWFRREGGTSRVLQTPSHLPGEQWLEVVPSTTLDRVTIEDVRSYAFRGDLSETYLLIADNRVQGPYHRDDGALIPADRRGFVARMDVERFNELFGLFEIGALPTPGATARRLVHIAPSLDDLLDEEAEPVDRLDPAALEVWLADLVREMAGSDVAKIAQAVARLEERGDDLPQAVLEHRLQLLGEFLESSRLFQEERRRAAERFVTTPEGQREVQRAASRRVDDELEVVKQQVAERRKALEAEVERLDGLIVERQAALRDLEGAEERRREELARETEDLQQQIDALNDLRQDAKTKLLAEILPGVSVPGRAAAAPAERPASVEPLTAKRGPSRSVGDLAELATELSRRLTAWSGQEVANLLASMVASPWTLMAGPPGVGKSTFARAFLSQLGHGPETGRCLELVVRRDWHDDSPLFGFWHPQKQAWEPSSEGFVELLLTAHDDESRSCGGLYTALLEELNLASPEYYLSRPISALEARTPQVRLYGSELRPANAARYPGVFPFPANTRLVGTVNVDETVERLSPRFLSRASVIWMEPVVESFDKPLELPEPPEVPVDWRSVNALVNGGQPPSLAPVMQLAAFLHEHRVSGAPTPRTIQGIQRYLSTARDLLPPKVAEDYQVLQRVLPCIRGVGERYRRLLDELSRLCTRQSWRMSAQRCDQIRTRGEELGDFYDFFHS